MEIELPAGCNIINSATSFYNYTNSNYTRSLYYLIDGTAYLSNSNTSTRPYEYSGTCLSTGDLIYKPETSIYLEALAIAGVIFIFWLIYKITIGRWIK